MFYLFFIEYKKYIHIDDFFKNTLKIYLNKYIFNKN